jgi:guanine nucleotide-binding protein alpha-1 subunit
MAPKWDSFLLWKSVCVHKLLKKATFVLLLNKYDLLEAKLKSGIQFRQFVTSYKDRPNKTEAVLACNNNLYSKFLVIRRLIRSCWTDLKEKFSSIYQQDPENTRRLHVHFTCATNSNSTSIVLARSTYINNLLCEVLRTNKVNAAAVREVMTTDSFKKANLL